MHRVVITGLGTVNALGDTPTRTFTACVARRSGVRRAPDLAVSGTIPMVASAAFDAERVVPRRRCAPLGRATAMALFVAREAKEHADERGAEVYAELAGYGLASDAAHIADPSAEGQARAMCAALRDAGIAPADVAYINAHAATVVGDRVESESIMRAFGAHAPAIPVSSTKALHGHVMGATGAIEFMIALLALQTGSVPPTAHLDAADRNLGLDFIPEDPRHGLDVTAVVSNSFAFGGTNAVLVARCADPRWARPPE
jgi:3-oxoacyl-(acyl-carrier-protein) synthase